MMVVNSSAAAGNTVIDNVVYGEDEGIGNSIFTSGVGTLFGYKVSGYLEGKSIDPWAVNSIGSAFSELVTRSSDATIKKIKDGLINRRATTHA